MSATELLPKIQSAIRDVVNNPGLVVNSESLLVDDLGLESIDLLDVSSELENVLGWELDFREVAEKAAGKSGANPGVKGLRVRHLIEYIEAKKS